MPSRYTDMGKIWDAVEWTSLRIANGFEENKFKHSPIWDAKQSFPIITRIHQLAVEFLRNIARSNFRPYDSCSKQVRICWTHWNQFLTVHFPSQIIFPFHHVCFLEWTFFYLSSSPVSSKLGSMGPTMWSIFPSITLHFFTAGAYLQVLLQFQSFSSTGKDSLERRKIRRYIDTNTNFFFSVKVKLFCLNFTLIYWNFL